MVVVTQMEDSSEDSVSIQSENMDNKKNCGDISDYDIKSEVDSKEEYTSSDDTAIFVYENEVRSSENPDPESKIGNENHAWADAMSKVLKTSTRAKMKRKSIVLSKAKLLSDAKKETDESKIDFEVDGETDNKSQIKEEPEKKPKEKLMKLSVMEKLERGRVKPSVLDREKERMLMKMATRGVVQLFNAVRQQQVTIDKKMKASGITEVKKERILKSIDKKSFLNVLMNTHKGQKEKVSDSNSNVEIKEKDEVEDQKEGEPTWKVLRDDFMMGAKLKDWDKQMISD